MSFSLDLKRFADKAGVNVDIVVKKVGLEILKSVVEKSPVDKGTFRNNWNLALGRIDSTTTDNTANDAVSRGEASLLSYNGGAINISNALPYAQRLENGYSQQSPNGMVALTVIEWQTFIKRAIKELK